MRIERLDHVNIQTHDLDATRDFYVDVIGLRLGDRPPFSFPGYWLYDNTVPVIHLTGLAPGDPSFHETGSINHIAFRASGLADTRERFVHANIPFDERIVPRNGECQLFLHDPNGVAIELTFTAAEVRSGEVLVRS